MKKTIIYDGKILGLSLYDLKIRGRKVKREIIEHRGAAAMLAFDEKGKVILVKQHRYPHGYVLEIPAGTLDKGENPRNCAFREIKEETGYSAKKNDSFTLILSLYRLQQGSNTLFSCFRIKKIWKLEA